jgi:hypothetical protein
VTQGHLTRRASLASPAFPPLVRETLAAMTWVVQQLMEAEVSELIGAERGERTPERLTHGNGYRPRVWSTRAGELELGSEGGQFRPAADRALIDPGARGRRPDGSSRRRAGGQARVASPCVPGRGYGGAPGPGPLAGA